MTKRDRSAEDYPVHGKRVAPAPERKRVTTVRLYEADVEFLQTHYPEGVSIPIRGVVRKFCDRLRKDNDVQPLGMPKE